MKRQAEVNRIQATSVVVAYSGGLDSTIGLCHYLARGAEVRALSVDYGQRHRLELDSARRVCKLLNVEHKVADLSGLRELMQASGSSQVTDAPVPHGHYAEENMRKTVVPNRNMLLLAVAGAWAVSVKAQALGYAAHRGDHAVYPDCRREFVVPMRYALLAADWHQVVLSTPFLTLTKADVVRLGAKTAADRPGLRVMEAVSLSYSCYEGRELHCGLCGTCQERRAAFRDAGVPDPTAYDPAGLAELPTERLAS